jgi:hypothetical protein
MMYKDAPFVFLKCRDLIEGYCRETAAIPAGSAPALDYFW